MTDIGKKWALIINGDTSPDHLANVDRALAVLSHDGYTTWVASPRAPSTTPHTSVITSDPHQIARALRTLQAGLHAGDDLVIYTTGHGTPRGLCFGNQCHTADLIRTLDALPFHRRVVVMDQCYSGNWRPQFVDDPRTLFITGGASNEQDDCQEIAPRLWSATVPDRDGDRIINWQERFAHVMQPPPRTSNPQYVPSPGFVDTGKPPFAATVLAIHTPQALDAALAQLGPGQFAIMLWSATWCGPCQAYKPHFADMAHQGNGLHLWLMTDNTALAAQAHVDRFPTVMALDARGRRQIVSPTHILEDLATFESTPDERWRNKISAAAAILEEPGRTRALREIAGALVNVDLGADATAVFRLLRDAAHALSAPAHRADLLRSIAASLARRGDRARADTVFRQAAATAVTIPDPLVRAETVRKLAVSLAGTGRGPWALVVFRHALATAETIPHPTPAAHALRAIAEGMAGSGFSSVARLVFDQAVVAAQSETNSAVCSETLALIAFTMTPSSARENVAALFAQAQQIAHTVARTGHRANVLRAVASLMAHGWDPQAMAVMAEALALAETVPDKTERAALRQTIANSLAACPDSDGKAALLREIGARE